MSCSCRSIVEKPVVSMRILLRVLGWLVLVGGPLTSVGIFWIDHMNQSLWTAMAISATASVALGGVLLWLGGRPGRFTLAP